MSDPEKLRDALCDWALTTRDEGWEQCLELIDAAGFAIVPKEPTRKMCAASGRVLPAEAYRAMLAAAPRLT